MLPAEKATRVGGLHDGHAGHLVNSKRIMDLTVRCNLRKRGHKM